MGVRDTRLVQSLRESVLESIKGRGTVSAGWIFCRSWWMTGL